MTALPRNPSSTRLRVADRGFTLTELLIVIAIIVLLVSLLLAAMTQVQAKGRETRTLATMQAFKNACDAFQQEQGFYPGVVPEKILSNALNGGILSGTENALLHLMGGFVRQDDVGETAFRDNYPTSDGWRRISFDDGSGSPYHIKVNPGLIGTGPIINDKPYAPYYTPGDDDIGVIEGQLGEEPGNTARIPEILDAWGQPIAYLRRLRSIGPLTSSLADGKPQFSLIPLAPYCESAGLGRLGRNQIFSPSSNEAGSTLSVVGDAGAVKTLAKLLEHPALAGQSRGAFLLISAGKDGIYLSAEDGPGAPGNHVEDPGDRIGLATGDPLYLPPTIFDEYDDVILYGGS